MLTSFITKPLEARDARLAILLKIGERRISINTKRFCVRSMKASSSELRSISKANFNRFEIVNSSSFKL